MAEAWAAASDADEADPEPIGLLFVSGDEAAADPSVRALAERAERVIAVTMFQALAVGWADIVLPATSYLERDGTYRNLEGRLQRLRRAVIPPAPDELAWIAKLAERFGVELPPHASVLFAELAEQLYGGATYGAVGEQAPLPVRVAYEAPAPGTSAVPPPPAAPADEHFLGPLRLLRYRALFSGPAVERVPELQFQRPEVVLELSPDDAERRQIASGDTVSVRSNGTSLALRATINRKLLPGVARIADEHAGDLRHAVEVVKA